MSIRNEEITTVEEEIARVQAAISAYKIRCAEKGLDPTKAEVYQTPSMPERAAIRRASLDLTRALAALRKPCR